MAGVWTRNYTNLLACFFAGPNNMSYTDGTAEYTSNNLTCRDINGNYKKIYNSVPDPYYNSAYIALAGGGTTARLPLTIGLYLDPSTSSGNSVLNFGLGNGSQADDHYEQHTLNSWITSGLSMPTQSPSYTVTYDSTNHKYTKTASFGISNISNTNKNISELGIFVNPFEGSKRPCMIYYDTFETITLEPYESVVITISQSFPLINYQPYPVT